MEIVPDTSVVVDGRVSERVRADADADSTAAGTGFAGATVVVPEAVVGELEAQANDGRETGWEGLAELQRLVELDADGTIDVEYVGRRPQAIEKREAGEGEVDALIREVAEDRDATLVTSDDVQAEVARAKGLDVEFLDPRSRERAVEGLAIERFFDEGTMSVHLKTGVVPMAKRGAIGDMHYEAVGDKVLTDDQLRDFAADIEEVTRDSPEGFVELDQPGMTIVQFRQFRVAIARPPFADGREITAVRPIVKTELDDYEHADELRDRLAERQRGVLISGVRGSRKAKAGPCLYSM